MTTKSTWAERPRSNRRVMDALCSTSLIALVLALLSTTTLATPPKANALVGCMFNCGGGGVSAGGTVTSSDFNLYFTGQLGTTNNGAYATLSTDTAAGGLINTDFQLQICFNDSNTGQKQACVKSPWASHINDKTQNNNSAWSLFVQGQGWSPLNYYGNWSPWAWPGSGTSLGGASNGYPPTIQVIPGSALPSGEVIGNLQIGIQLAEDNQGKLSGTTTNLGDDFCSQVFTPISGGPSNEAFSWVYGDSNCGQSPYQAASNSPNEFRFYMNDQAGTRSASISSNLPSQGTVNQTIPVTFNVTNSGSTPFVDSTWSYSAQGYPAGQGLCQKDNDSDGINEAPDTNYDSPSNQPPQGYSSGNWSWDCSINGTETSADIMLTGASGIYQNPSVSKYSISNLAKTSTFYYSLLQYPIVPTPPTGPTSYTVSKYFSGVGFNKNIQFDPGVTWSTVVNITLPSTPGQFCGTWTFTDGDSSTIGAITGDQYTGCITVQAATGTMNVKADRAASWWIAGATTHYSDSVPSTSVSYANVPADQYTMYDGSTRNTPPYGFANNPTSTGSSCSGWTCKLLGGGTVNYDLTSTTCNVSVRTSVDGDAMDLPLSFAFAGPLNDYSYSSSPQAPYSIADASGSLFSLSLPAVSTVSGLSLDGQSYSGDLDYAGTDVTVNGTTFSFPASTTSPNASCSGGGSLTFVAKYLTRAGIQVK